CDGWPARKSAGTIRDAPAHTERVLWGGSPGRPASVPGRQRMSWDRVSRRGRCDGWAARKAARTISDAPAHTERVLWCGGAGRPGSVPCREGTCWDPVRRGGRWDGWPARKSAGTIREAPAHTERVLWGGSPGRPASVPGRQRMSWDRVSRRGRCDGWPARKSAGFNRESPEKAGAGAPTLSGLLIPHSIIGHEARAPKRVGHRSGLFAASRPLDLRCRRPWIRFCIIAGAPMHRPDPKVGPSDPSVSPEGDPETRPRVSPRFGRRGVSPNGDGGKLGGAGMACKRKPCLIFANHWLVFATTKSGN